MPNATPYAMVRKIFSWFVFAVLVVTLVLILKKSPAPNVATSPAAAASAEQKLEVAGQAAASGQPAQVQLNSTELNSYLAQNLQFAGSSNSELAAAGQPNRPISATPDVAGADPQTVAEAESNVKDVKIDLAGDVLTAYVIFNVHGADLSLQISGHLYTDGGYLRFEPTDGKIGSFPLPQSALDDAVQKLMASPENREKLRLPDNVSNIEVEDGQVVVSYK
jgi:hypothetical protein